MVEPADKQPQDVDRSAVTLSDNQDAPSAPARRWLMKRIGAPVGFRRRTREESVEGEAHRDNRDIGFHRQDMS